MNRPDRLELELAALRPCEPSPQLKKRINEQLIGAASLDIAPASTSWWPRGALAAALLAASLLAVMAWHNDVRTTDPQRTPIALEAVGLRAAFDRSAPSFWSYRKALCHSTDSVDDLLEQHAFSSLEPMRSAPPLVLARFSFHRDSFTGEL